MPDEPRTPPPAPGPWRRTARALRRLLALPLALLLLFEEWGWEPLHRAMAWLGRWPPLRRLEARIAALPPRAALAAFLLPSLGVLPVKLAALWLVGRGQVLAGLVLIVLAKLVGTAVLARLFSLTQPALMTLPWFAHLYGRFSAWKQGLYAWVRASWAWRWGRVLKRAVARRVRALLRAA